MILMYHKVDLWARTMWWVDVGTFHRQMLALRGRKVVYLDEYDPSAPDHVSITFDGVYRNVLVYAAPILKSLGFPFELFVSSDLIGRENEFDSVEPPSTFASFDDLRDLVAHGGRLQWHTRTHRRLDCGARSKYWPAVEQELEVPDDVRKLDSSGFRWFAYPYGVFSEDVYDAVKERFAGAVSCHQGSDRDIHKLNRMTITNDSKLEQTSLSVVVVSHNYGAFLSEAIESVLVQTLQPDAILLVDDASTDDTESVCRRYVDLYPSRISYLRNERRLGIVHTFRRAVEAIQSDYVCFLGADNRFASNYVELCKGALDASRGKAAIAYTDFFLFGPKAQDEYLRHDVKRRGRVIDGVYYEIVFPEFGKGALLEGGFIHGSAMYRRDAYLEAGGYREQQDGRPEDANLFRRMIKAGRSGIKVRGTWLEYRQHSADQANIVSRTQGELQFYRAYAKRLEAKVKLLESSFGLLSPFIRLLSTAETACFEIALRIVRLYRRVF